MVELKTYKYKLYNRDALKYLDNILVVAGRIYNHCIALHRRYYGIYHKMLNKYQLQKHLTKLKKQYPEWNEVPSQAIQDITDRIDRAYRLFFSNLKAGKKTRQKRLSLLEQQGFRRQGQDLDRQAQEQRLLHICSRRARMYTDRVD